MACSCIPFWSTAATVFPLVSNNKLVSKRITRAEYLNGAINPCGPKGGINTSKPRHDRPLAESSLDGTGSNYLQLNRTSRLLDYHQDSLAFLLLLFQHSFDTSSSSSSSSSLLLCSVRS